MVSSIFCMLQLFTFQTVNSDYTLTETVQYCEKSCVEDKIKWKKSFLCAVVSQDF